MGNAYCTKIRSNRNESSYKIHLPNKKCCLFLSYGVPLSFSFFNFLIPSIFPFFQETLSSKYFLPKGMSLHIHRQFKKYNPRVIFLANCSCNYVLLLDVFYVIKTCKYFISLKFPSPLLADPVLFPACLRV